MSEYKRVLLKFSGEALAGDKKQGFDEETCIGVAKQVKTIVDKGIEVAVVIGGGNFWRGRNSNTIDRFKADQIGMLATVMNCVYVSEIFRYVGMDTEIYTPYAFGDISEMFTKDRAVRDLKAGKVIFLAGGTGHPYFSTDTATALRAVELGCDIIMMAKAIDGVYSADPNTDPTAVKFDKISLEEVFVKKLKVIDTSATVICMENKMPLLIFALNEENSIINNASGNCTGTIVTAD
ncbi:MAG: UMP kinase [Lachnospiraceae bacterium]|nr:UMP kinase [Lachnospiraceae bacterium]